MERPQYLEDLELVYVVFDVLYDNDHSVIDRPLQERHEILRNMFKPLEKPSAYGGGGGGMGGGGGGGSNGDGGGGDSDGGNETDDGGESGDETEGAVDSSDGSVHLGPLSSVVRGRVVLNVPATSDGQPENPDCVVGKSLDDIQEQLRECINKQEEGLVLKDLSSKWIPGERLNKRIKVKPDYLPTEDLDCVIIGGFYGTGKRGGKISEYLLGIVEAPPEGAPPGTLPTHVMSFSKVGIGMSEKVLAELRQKLGGHMVSAGKNFMAPKCYKVTNAAAERPDVWISHPSKSVVLTVKADIRLVPSNTFFSPYSLRFPRVTGVHWNKPWD